MNPTDMHEAIVKQRLALCDIAEQFDADQLATPSLCDGWTVRDVLSHVMGPMEFSALRAVGPIIRARFNFDRFTQLMVAADTRSGPQLVEAMRKGASGRWTPPGFGFEAPLTDIIVHTGDICIPLGIDYAVDPQAARGVLDFLVTSKARRAFTKASWMTDVRFAADDVNWGFGTGPEVVGPARLLPLAIAGRRSILSHLRGDGVAVLASRTA